VSTQPLRILHLAANRWWTGSADPIIRLVDGLRERGHHVLLGVTPGDRFEAKAREAGLPLVEGLHLRARLAPIELARDAMRLRALVAAEAIDIIHAHHSHDHWLGFLARRGSPAALVRTFHNARSVRLGWPSPALYRRTDALIAVSREIEERARHAGVPAERLARVDGVVDVGRFETGDGGAAIRKEFDLGGAPALGVVHDEHRRTGEALAVAARAGWHDVALMQGDRVAARLAVE